MPALDDRGVIADDAVLPAAAHLTGPHAGSVLAPALAAAGLELAWWRPSQVQYRPGSDLVVRFRARVRSRAGATTETLLASTTAAGPPPGTLHVEADTTDGTTLHVGVWRWPFDPVLPALEHAVTPDLAGALLGDLVGPDPRVEVVAYRPTERAVVRVESADGRHHCYVKVVAPDAIPALVVRHDRLRRAGLPVPRICASGPGWVAMEPLTGPTLRDRLKTAGSPWPAPAEFSALLDGLRAVDPTGFGPTRSRLADAPEHAAMLATVLPSERPRLERIAERLRAFGNISDPHRTVVPTVIHGDLHEAQLVLDDDRIVGLLDIDDVGTGDPLDDVGTLVGHLVYRGTTTERGGGDIVRYAARLRAALSEPYDARAVDHAVAAALVGLATGPFRIQQDDWQRITRGQLDTIERLLDPSGRRTADERDLRPASSPPHLGAAG